MCSAFEPCFSAGTSSTTRCQRSWIHRTHAPVVSFRCTHTSDDTSMSLFTLHRKTPCHDLGCPTIAHCCHRYMLMRGLARPFVTTMSSSTPRTPRPSHGHDRTPGDRTQHLDCPCLVDASVTLAFPRGWRTGVPWTCLTPTHGPRASQPWTLALTLPAEDQDRAFYGRSPHGHACTHTQAP